MHKRLFLIGLVAVLVLVGTASAGVPPVASFTVNETDICLGDTVLFNDTSQWVPTEWLWSFGDGNTSTEQNVTYTYGYTGSFTVSLTATNAFGNDTYEEKAYITVTDCAGNPDFTANVTCQIGKPLSVLFTGYCPSPEFKNYWAWGDGNHTDDIQSPEYTYLEYGAYTVTHMCWKTPYPQVYENKTDYIIIGVDGTICPGSCPPGYGGSSDDDDDWDLMWLIYGIVGGIVGVVLLSKR